MKRKFYYLLLVAFAIISCATGSEEENEIKNEVDETQKPFMGGWNTSDRCVWVFRPDGVCIFYDYNSNWDSQGEVGEWLYNPATSILATTIDSYSWQITIVAENAWSGIGLDSDKTSQSFKRVPDHDLAKYAIEGVWKEGDKEVIFQPYTSSGHFSGNVYEVDNNDYYFFSFNKDVGDEYDGVCLVSDNHYTKPTNPNWNGSTTHTYSIDTMMMSMRNGWMNEFVCKSSKETGGIRTFTRVIAK